MLGSLAASAMSSTAIASGCGVAAGSAVAILQSAATGGAGAAIVNGVAGAARAAATAIAAALLFLGYWKNLSVYISIVPVWPSSAVCCLLCPCLVLCIIFLMVFK